MVEAVNYRPRASPSFELAKPHKRLFKGAMQITQITSIMTIIRIRESILIYVCMSGYHYRNHYQCTTQAAKLMVPRRHGLIVNISSPAGLRYLFNVPYGIGKEAVSKGVSERIRD